MIFAEIPLEDCPGAILAHSLKLESGKLAKGKVLDAADIAALRSAGIKSLCVAKPGPGDRLENDAAERLAKPLCGTGLRIAPVTNGRANLIATEPGLLVFDPADVHRLNLCHQDLTFACLAPMARVDKGSLAGTVKIIPYAIEEAVLDQAVATAGPLRVRPFGLRSARLILTDTPALKPRLLAKGQKAIEDRLHLLGFKDVGCEVISHEVAVLRDALHRALRPNNTAPLILVLGASATCDRHDVIPQAILAAGGELTCVGMPVDPGNLLTLGYLRGMSPMSPAPGLGIPVVGLPGCARSPALNGADYVLERLAAGMRLTRADIAAMGVGGLLKEIPGRPAPRMKPALKSRVLKSPMAASRTVNARTKNENAQRGQRADSRIELLLLAAGRSLRMQGEDKLLKHIDGQPLLLRSVRALTAPAPDPASDPEADPARASASLGGIRVVIQPGDAEKRALLKSTGLRVLEAEHADKGMAYSIRAGVAAVPEDTAALIIALADMPDIGSRHTERLISAYRANPDALVVCFENKEGLRGNPVLLDAALFENLRQITGDKGAKHILNEIDPARIITIRTNDPAILLDLDTQTDWANKQTKS